MQPGHARGRAPPPRRVLKAVLAAALIAVGAAPFGVAISPDSKTAFVGNTGSNSLSVIDTASMTVTRTIALGTRPVAHRTSATTVANSRMAATAMRASESGSSIDVGPLLSGGSGEIGGVNGPNV